MSAAHTPGPWSIREGYGLLKTEVGPSDRAVATVWTKRMPNGKEDQKDPVAWSEGEANARLIAAAPELLAALSECGEWFGLTKPPLDQWEDMAKEFYKETGFLRPGKDYPMAAGLDEEREAERNATWNEWAERRRSEMIARIRAAIARASLKGDSK